MGRTKKADTQQTICWYCKKAAGYDGGCNWSNYCIGKCDTPEVENWVAEKRVAEKSTLPLSHLDGGLTFIVHNCPEFTTDEILTFVKDGCYDKPYYVKLHMEIIENNLKYIVDTIDFETEEIMDTFIMDSDFAAQKKFDMLCLRQYNRFDDSEEE